MPSSLRSYKLWLLVYLLLLSINLTASGIDNGEALHSKNCTRCHNSEIYQRPDRKLKSYQELVERVQQCELAVELGWFEEEVEAVADYLNKSFYKFTD